MAGLPAPAPGPAQRPAAITPGRRFAGWAPEPGLLTAPDCRFDLRAGIPDAGLFPADAWRRRVNAASAAMTGSPPAGDPAGEIELRRAIARWAGRSRSVAADASTVVVTSGAQHAVDLVARVLLEPGDTVAVENPGYLPVVRLLRSLGANVVGVPVDDQGLVVGQLPPAARIVYITPSHQLPLGVVMSMPRRSELLTWAGRHDAAVIEDDYDSEFRYVDRPLEPIQRLDDSGRVIYIGSFSKTLSPGLRLGFAVVPPSLAGPIAALRQLIDWHRPSRPSSPWPGSSATGSSTSTCAGPGGSNGQRHRILQAALAGPLSAGLAVIPARAGLHITALLRPGHDEDSVRAAAAERGIATTSLAQYYHAGPAQQGLVIGFGAIDAGELTAAVRVLSDVLDAQS